jgi:fructokinase
MSPEPAIMIVGDTLVDLLPERPGRPGEAGGYFPKVGGTGANVALALDRLGVPAHFWTRFGGDDFGTFVRDELDRSDLDTTYVVQDETARTTVALVTHDAAGERSFSFYRENTADARMEPGRVTDETLDRMAWVHTTGLTLSLRSSPTAMLELVERVPAATTLSFDPNWRAEMWSSRQEFATMVRGLLPEVDVLKTTAEDIGPAGFDTRDPEALLEAIAALGPDTVVLTRGAEGALCYGTPRSPVPGLHEHPGYEVDGVDTTGAGDVFLAGFIAGLTSGLTDGRALLAVANAAGAVATTEPGGNAALTNLDRIRQLHGEIPWETPTGGDD